MERDIEEMLLQDIRQAQGLDKRAVAVRTYRAYRTALKTKREYETEQG